MKGGDFGIKVLDFGRWGGGSGFGIRGSGFEVGGSWVEGFGSVVGVGVRGLLNLGSSPASE